MRFGIFRCPANNWKQEKSTEHFFLFLIFFKLAGILPSESVFSRPWKIKIYNIYSALSLLWFVPVMIAQMFVLHQHWGNIGKITGITFELAVAINASSTGLYLVLNRTQLQLIISKMQSAFRNYTKNLHFGRKYRLILREASGRNAIFSWIVIATNFSGILIWVIFPFVLWCTEMKQEEEIFESTNNIYDQEIHWKYFCFKMWLPPNATHTPVYQILWVYQAFPIYSLTMIFTGYNLLFFALTTFTAAHFKILAVILRDSSKPILLPDIRQDKELGSTDFESDNDSLLNERTYIWKSGKEFKKPVCLKYDTEQELVLRSHANDELLLKRKTNFQEHEARRIQQTNETTDYLVYCIKYHQALLEFCEDVNRLYSPLLFIFFCLSLFMMCTTVFQITLGSEQNHLKFIIAAISVWVPIFLICWYGEHLTEQSLAVQQAAYECRWYNSSPRFKKHLMYLVMRSQKPVRLTAGKFFAVSLEGFSEIAHNVYVYFALLKQMHSAT